MSVRYVPMPLRWRTFVLDETGIHRAAEAALLRRLGRILEAWEGTPYRIGQCLRGTGAYCTAFLCAVLDDLYRRPEATPLPEIPIDASMHAPETARSGLRWFLEHYPNHERVQPGPDGYTVVQPGDVLVTGPQGGGPGHAILVGPRENTLWQCSGLGVHYTGLALYEHYDLYAVYRMTDRHQWLSI